MKNVIIWFKWGLWLWGCLSSEIIMYRNLWEVVEEEQAGYPGHWFMCVCVLKEKLQPDFYTLRKSLVKLGSDYKSFKILTEFEIRLHHAQEEKLCRCSFSFQTCTHYKYLKIMAHHTQQDIVKIIDTPPHVTSREDEGANQTNTVESGAVRYTAWYATKEKEKGWVHRFNVACVFFTRT